MHTPHTADSMPAAHTPVGQSDRFRGIRAAAANRNAVKLPFFMVIAASVLASTSFEPESTTCRARSAEGLVHGLQVCLGLADGAGSSVLLARAVLVAAIAIAALIVVVRTRPSQQA